MDTTPDKQTVLEIAAAATVLDISIETLRKRLQRGRAQGFKAADGSWRVVLDNGMVRRTVADDTEAVLSEQRRLGDRLDDLAETLDRLEEKLGKLSGQVERLDRRLEKFPALAAVLERKADERPIEEHLKPVMLTLLEVVKALRQAGVHH